MAVCHSQQLNPISCSAVSQLSSSVRVISCQVPVTTVICNAKRLFVRSRLRCRISFPCCRVVSVFAFVTMVDACKRCWGRWNKKRRCRRGTARRRVTLWIHNLSYARCLLWLVRVPKLIWIAYLHSFQSWEVVRKFAKKVVGDHSWSLKWYYWVGVNFCQCFIQTSTVSYMICPHPCKIATFADSLTFNAFAERIP